MKGKVEEGVFVKDDNDEEKSNVLVKIWRLLLRRLANATTAQVDPEIRIDPFFYLFCLEQRKRKKHSLEIWL